MEATVAAPCQAFKKQHDACRAKVRSGFWDNDIRKKKNLKPVAATGFNAR
jgi:hypothetical protein